MDKDDKIETFGISPDNNYLTFLTKKGKLKLVSRKTKQWITDFQMNSKVTSSSFSHDSKYLYSAGSEGAVYVWDMVQHRCVHKYKDRGNTTTTTLSNCPRGLYQATGSSEGVVNVYNDVSTIVSSHVANPIPHKEFLNLQTAITSLAFSHDSQILAFASDKKKQCSKIGPSWL